MQAMEANLNFRASKLLSNKSMKHVDANVFKKKKIVTYSKYIIKKNADVFATMSKQLQHVWLKKISIGIIMIVSVNVL